MQDAHQEIEAMRSAGAWRIWEPLYHTRDWCRGYGFHIALLFIIAIFGLGGYETTLLFAMEQGHTAWDPSSAWDFAIPALPWSVIVYMTLYLYSPLPLFVAKRDERGRRELAFLTQGMLLLFTISFAFFLFMPAEVIVVPQMKDLLGSMDPLYRDVFQVVYAFDRPFNSWPSLHVSQSLLIVLFCQRWLEIRADEFPRRRAWMTGLWLAWAALSLSILTTKQHFIWDMVTGAVLGGIIWWIYILPRLEQRVTSRQAVSATAKA